MQNDLLTKPALETRNQRKLEYSSEPVDPCLNAIPVITLDHYERTLSVGK